MVISVVMVSIFMLFFMSKEMLTVMMMILSLGMIMNLSVISSDSIELMGVVSSDFLSASLMTLSVFICLLSLMSSKNLIRGKLFSLLVMVLSLVLVLAFSVSSFFLFFFFFEAALIPLIIIIIGWGYQPERLQASTYMFIYTVFGSLFFLLGVSLMYYFGQSDSMLGTCSFVFKSSTAFWWLFILGFMIKLPVYPFHLWLPKAHVEAPVAGSMILAGVVLKLGGYGIIRLASIINVMSMWKILSVMMSFGLMGGLFASLVCCRQIDLKCLVAYSSVGHMSLVMLGCLSNSWIGVKGALVVMIGHGFCSSGLFSLVNSFYLNSLSRSLFMNKGFLIKIPILAMFGFVLCIGNMAAPPSLNLFGEILLFMCVLNVSFVFLVIFMLMSFVSAVYSLYLYVISCHGKSSDYLNSISVVSFMDLFVLICHFVPLNLLIFFMI